MTFFQGQTEQQLGSGLAATNDQNIARRLKLVQDAAPMFGQGEAIKTAMQFAQSDMDDQALVKAAQQSAGTALVKNYRSYLENQADPLKQWKAWQSFDKGQQRLLTKDGYVPPAQPYDPGDTSIFGITKSVLGGAFHTATSLPGIHQGLELVNEAAGIGTHTYRAARLGVEEEGLFGTSLGRQIADDPEIRKRRRNVLGDLANLWGRTSDGEEVFSIKAQNRVRNSVPDTDKYHFVQALAAGKTPYDYLTEDLGMDEGTPQFQTEIEKYSQFQGQEDVINAVKDLRNNRYSPGRDLASGVGLHRGTLLFDVTSGGIDATFRVVTDPTLTAGKIYKGYRVGAFGVDAALDAAAAGDKAAMASRIDHLATVPRFRAAATQIADRFASGSESLLLDELPQMRGGGLNDLNNWLLEKEIPRESMTSDHVFQFFKEDAGTAALREGKFAAPHFPGTILPSLSKPAALKTSLALGAKDWVEGFRLADYGFDALTPAQLKELFGVAGKTQLEIQKGIGNALHSFYTKVPKEDFIGPDSDHGIEQFRAVLDYSMPNFLRDEFVNDWMRTGDYSARRAIYESGVSSMFHYAGALSTEEGQKILAKTLGAGKAYGADAIDLLDGKATGIGEADLAEHWAIPDFKDMLRATGDTTRLRKVLDYTNDGMVNRFMATYWKPAVLLKAGFIPRAYGEEYLGFILREGPTSWFKAQAAITATRDGYLLPLRPVGWIADSLLSHIPYIPGADAAEVYSHNFAAGTSNFVRDWAEKLAPDSYLNAARNLAENNGMDSAGRLLGTAYGEASAPVGQRILNETIGRREAGGEVVQVPIRHGDVTLHGKGDAFHAHTVLREMRRMQSDRLFAPLMDAGRRQFTAEEASQIHSQFSDAGLIESKLPSQGANLWNIRNLVPDEVMPKFESFLRNTSHANHEVVTQELVEHGMESDTARELVSQVGNLDARYRVALFTRDGELERMYKSVTLDPDAPFDVESNLPYVRQEVENRSQREYQQIMHDIYSEGTNTDAYNRLAFRRLNMADMQDTVRKSYRSRKLLDGRVVAEPPTRGSRRVYTLLMDQDPAPITSAFEDMGNLPGVAKEAPRTANINPIVDADVGYVPFQTQEINSLIPDVQPNSNVITMEGGEQAAADEMAWFTQDFSHAQGLQQRLAAKYKGQNVHVGYVDVPENVFQEGRTLAKANAAGGLDPLALQNQANQTWIPKTYRDRFQVIGDDYQLIDDNHRLWQDHLNQLNKNFEQQNPLARKAADASSIQSRISKIKNQLEKYSDPQSPFYNNVEMTVYDRGLPRKDYFTREEATNELNNLEAQLPQSQLTAEETAQLDQLRASAIDLRAEASKFHAAVGVDRSAALRDWASVITQRYGQVFESQNPMGLADVLHQLQDGRINVLDIANKTDMLNEFAVGPTVIEPGKDNLFNQMVRGGFDAIGRGGNAMIRNQMFLHNYARRLEQETTRMTTLLGEKGATQAINSYADQLGTSHWKLRAEWNALPEDIRNAANPYQAMVARDPIPDSLRSLESSAREKELAEAATALYEHDNPVALQDLEKEWRKKGYLKDAEYSINDMVDSYIGLDPELRASIAGHGVPLQIPKVFESSQTLTSDDWTSLREALNTNRHIYKTAHDVAMKGAINDTIPWVDDHRVRSQFQQHGRNLFPFWFAQENFIKRTFQNLARDPAAIRKAELMLDGLHNVGVVTQNQFGEDVFNIPMTGTLVKTLAKGADFFGAYSLPIENPMTGQLKYTLPGLDSLDRIGPSFSPIIAIPLEAAARKFPELEQAKQSLLGERGQGKSIPEMLMPSYAYKFYQGLIHDPASDEEMVATSISVAKQLEATGHGLPENADVYQHDDWMKRIQNHTRLQFMLKAMVGFFSPASPSVSPPDELTPEFQEYLKHMPLDEAIVQFTEKNPDAKPYTIFNTQVPSGAPLPVSESAGQFIEQNAEYFHNHPDAGPWLLPQNDDETGFSNSTYNTEMARGLRERKSLKDWYDDYYFASAATDYFDTKEGYDRRMLAAKNNPTLRRQLTDQYQTWKDGYLGEHKIFSQLLVSPDAQQRRQRILDGMDAALSDPNAPEVQHKEALQDMVDTYKGYLSRKQEYRRNTTNDQVARQGLEDQFTLWVGTFMQNNPQIQSFYDRVIRPELGA